jgi:hypothetical protein
MEYNGKLYGKIGNKYFDTGSTSTDFDKLLSKAEKYDKLMKEISKFYCDENGDFSENKPENNGDLCDIGEIAASHFGFI